VSARLLRIRASIVYLPRHRRRISSTHISLGEADDLDEIIGQAMTRIILTPAGPRGGVGDDARRRVSGPRDRAKRVMKDRFCPARDTPTRRSSRGLAAARRGVPALAVSVRRALAKRVEVTANALLVRPSGARETWT
jgi:hypothetical protein